MSDDLDIDQLQVHSDDSDVEGPAGCVVPIIGDVIGDTAYSQRYVIRVLMKFANLEVFKRVSKQETFDAELVTLWEMSVVKGVVDFLLEHDALDLFGFALPALDEDSQRIAELAIGIIANMCCHKESVLALLKNKTLLSVIMGYLRTDYTAAIHQSLRVISHCVFQTDPEDRNLWLSTFDEHDYAETLCFILKNSSNRELLIAALENFNTLCEYLNVGPLRKDFFKQFVTPEVLESVSIAFDEIMVKQKNFDEGDSLERILAITLQIGLNLVWFDNTPQIYTENRSSVVTMISQILDYYEHKIVDKKEIDTTLEHIFQSASLILNTLNVSEISNPNEFFFPGYRIWKALSKKQDKYGDPLSKSNAKKVDLSLCQLNEFMCIYMAQCTDRHFNHVMDIIEEDYTTLVEGIQKPELQELIENRVAAYTDRKSTSLG